MTVLIPGPPYDQADSLDEAKAAFREAWTGFKAKQSPHDLDCSASNDGKPSRPLFAEVLFLIRVGVDQAVGRAALNAPRPTYAIRIGWRQ
jgi:hypothetical protein